MRKLAIYIFLGFIFGSCNSNRKECNFNYGEFYAEMNIPCDTNFYEKKIIVNDSLSQIYELEQEISSFSDPDDYTENIASARLLNKIDPFNERGIRYICDYYKSLNIDSVTVFLDNLITKYPFNFEPLKLRANLLFLEFETYKDSIYVVKEELYLKKALDIDTSNSSICYDLAEMYYRDFLKDFGNNSFFENSGDSALKYFIKTAKYDSNLNDVLFFPICQLKKYKDKTIKIELDHQLGIGSNCFMPSWYFANLSEDWAVDFTRNYLFDIEMSKGSAEWLKIQLEALKEPCLYNLEVPKNYEIYRFTWLRTFHNPIAIRIVKTNDIIELYWKVGKGSGGYEPQGIKEYGKRELSEIEWKQFIKSFNKLNFETLPNELGEPMCDGASWILERKKKDSYKAFETNIPYKDFSMFCLQMVKMSGIQVNEDNIY